MPDLAKKKVGLVSCSGEEIAEGTLARMATLRVLEQVRHNETVTICLPLFLAGGDKERAFAKFQPTITIDGCSKRCAARATEKYSAKPTASIIIPDVLAAQRLQTPRSRRQMDMSRESAVDALAQAIAQQVDTILGIPFDPAIAPQGEQSKSESVAATCSCGSGVSVLRLNIAGQEIELIALPVIFEQARQAHKSFADIFETVKIYNAIPAESELAYRDAIFRAYAAFTLTPEKREE